VTAASGSAAAANALNINQGYSGKCLQFVRTVWDVSAKYATAKAAWDHAGLRHPDLSNAPIGAPVFFSHPKVAAGHVALYLGNGKIRSTNSATGRVSTYPISTWTGWGYSLLGWTEDLNGVELPIDPVPSHAPQPSAAKEWRVGTSGTQVENLQRGLNAHFPAYSRLTTDGKFGPKTEAVVKEFQRRTGLTPDGIVGVKTTDKLAGYGIIL